MAAAVSEFSKSLFAFGRSGNEISKGRYFRLDYSSLMKLENQLDDLLLPYKIDLSLYRNISNPDLTDHIQRVGKVFYEKTPHPDSPKKSARPKHGKTNTK